MWKTPAFAVCLSSVHSKNILNLCQIHGLRTDAEKMWSANQVKSTEVTLFFHTVHGALACSRLSYRREVAKKRSAWPGKEDSSGSLSPVPARFSHQFSRSLYITIWILEQAIPSGSAMLNFCITDHCTCFQYSVGLLSRVKPTNDTTTTNENSLTFYLRLRQGPCGCKVIRSRMSRTVISLENR